jgi:hypothetical protein
MSPLHSSILVPANFFKTLCRLRQTRLQTTRYPRPEYKECTLTWKSRDKRERVPTVIDADFESFLVPVNAKAAVVD